MLSCLWTNVSRRCIILEYPFSMKLCQKLCYISQIQRYAVIINVSHGHASYKTASCQIIYSFIRSACMCELGAHSYLYMICIMDKIDRWRDFRKIVCEQFWEICGNPIYHANLLHIHPIFSHYSTIIARKAFSKQNRFSYCDAFYTYWYVLGLY